MYKISKEEHAANVAAIDRPQKIEKPSLTFLTYKKSVKHENMLFGNGFLEGKEVSFVAVKGQNTWAAYYENGNYSEYYLAVYGKKLTIDECKQLFDIDQELLELYRK